MTHLNDDTYDRDNPQIIRSVSEINKQTLQNRPQGIVLDQFSNVPDPTDWKRFEIRRTALSLPKSATATYRENVAENGLNLRYYPATENKPARYMIQLDHNDPLVDPVGHFVEDLNPTQQLVGGLALIATAKWFIER